MAGSLLAAYFVDYVRLKISWRELLVDVYHIEFSPRF